MLWRSGHQSCSDGFCGAGNVLVGGAVTSNICDALNRPLREPHPEEATALAAKAEMLATLVAVDEYARVTTEKEASKLYEASPWRGGQEGSRDRPSGSCADG